MLKTRHTFKILFLGVHLLTVLAWGSANAQVVANSIATGNWNAPSTWSCNCVPNSSNGTITIQAGHTVTLTAPVTVDQLVVASGGTLTISAVMTVQNDGTSAADVINAGTISNTTASNLVIQSGAVYQHNQSNGVVPTATWSTGATCEITGWGSAASNAAFQNSLSQSFHHFVWNCPLQTQLQVSLNGRLTSVNGDLRIISTGAPLASNRRLLLGLNSLGTASLTVGGNFEISGNSQVTLSNAGTYNVVVTGNTTINTDNTVGGAVIFRASSGTTNFTSNGNFIVLKGDVDLVGSIGTSGVTNLNIQQNFTFTGGTLSEEAGTATINFVGDRLHSYSRASGVFSQGPGLGIGFVVDAADTLDLSTFSIGPVGGAASPFTCNGTVILGSNDVAGTIEGNISAVTKTFNSGSSVIYQSNFAQYLGSSHPILASTVIDNPAGVSLISDATIGDLDLKQGNLIVGANQLSLQGSVTPRTNAIVTSSTSSLEIAGTGAFGTLPIIGSSSLNNFLINRNGGSVGLPFDLTINGTFSQTAGTLLLNNRRFVINGDFIGSGNMNAGTGSSLILNNEGQAPGDLVLSGILDTLRINRPDQSIFTSSFFQVENLELVSGLLSNTNGLTMLDGGVIRVSGGNMDQSPSADGTYDVIYSNPATINTSAELQLGSVVRDVTVSGAGIVVFNGEADIARNWTIGGGGISGTGEINLFGNLVVNTVSDFSGVTINFSGISSISGSVNPELGTVNVIDGATLNLPSVLNVSQNLSFASSSIVNNNLTSVLNFVGSLQSFSPNGKTFNQITCNNSVGGIVTLTSALNLVGTLQLNAASSTFAANGNLLLISTSDGASGNASIGPLLNGASVTGSVTVQRFMSNEGRIYRYLSSPILNAPVSELQDDIPVTGGFAQASVCSGCFTGSPSLYFYNGATSQYVAYPTGTNTLPLEPGRGYATFIYQNTLPGAATIDISGTINQGQVILPVAFNAAAAESWNLVGNPYPSSIDWDTPSAWTKTNISGSIAVRDNGVPNGTFQYWNGSTGGLSGGVIGQGQAFWIQTTAASPQLIVNENAKTSTTGTFFREEKINEMVIRLKKGNLEDAAYLVMMKESRSSFDFYDATKLANAFLDIATKFDDSPLLAINATNAMDCSKPLMVRLRYAKNASGGYVVNPVGTYEMRFELSGDMLASAQAELVDAYTGTRTKLTDNLIYYYNVDSNPLSAREDRFTIYFSESNRPEPVVFSAPESVCGDDEVELVLESTKSGYHYEILLEGQTVSAHSGDGQPLSFVIPGASLKYGTNGVMLRVDGICGTIETSERIIAKDMITVPVASEITSCGPSTFVLNTGHTGGRFEWFRSKSDLNPFFVGTELSTGMLATTTTFLVRSVSAHGCTSNLIPVTARVMSKAEAFITYRDGFLVSSSSTGNTWYFNGEPLNTSASEIPLQQSGVYRLTISVDGCVSDFSEEFVVQSIEDQPIAKGVFPNPFDDILDIELPEGVEALVSMMNALGQTVQVPGNKISGQRLRLTTVDLAPGMYTLIVKAEGRIRSYKVIKR